MNEFNVKKAFKVLAAKQDSTVQQIAIDLDMSPQNLHNKLTRNRVTFALIFKLCDCYRLSLDEFVSYGK